jgi:hypothetical protein
MVAVALGQSIGVSTGSTPLFFVNTITGSIVSEYGSAGTLATPYALTYEIQVIATDEQRGTPVTTLAPTSVDLVNDMVSPGVFAVDWTVPSSEPLGLHQVIWTLTATPTSAPQRFRREFDVLRGVAGFAQKGYALVSDFRHEGVTVERASDTRLQLLIEEWSGMLDVWCRRFFEPRQQQLLLDGNDSTTLALRIPIIGVSDVSSMNDEGGPEPIDLTALRFYNRHLTQGMVQPDDRDAPRIEFVLLQPILIGMSSTYYPQQMFRSGRWSRGTQNIRVTGVFGYTDLDGSPAGDTPMLARRAVQLLVMRNLPKLVRVNDRFDARERHRITTESTGGQSYSLAARWGAQAGEWTGDPEVDQLISRLTAPTQLAST